MGDSSPLYPAGTGKARSCVKRKFTAEEDRLLMEGVAEFGENNWKRTAAKVGTRNCRQCRERWKNYLDPSVSQDAWSIEEDELLREKCHEMGSQWSLIAKHFPARTDVNCRNRWVFLTSHIPHPKRVRRNTRHQKSDPNAWVWDEVEIRQTFEEAGVFGFDESVHSFF
jgi:hypothetical protein